MRHLLALLLAGPALAEVPPAGIEAEGGALRAVLADGRRLGPEALEGMVVPMGALALRIEQARRHALAPGGEVWLYRISVRAAGGGWVELCAPDEAGERHALVLPLAGGFGLTCSAGAIGACLRQASAPAGCAALLREFGQGIAVSPIGAVTLGALRFGRTELAAAP